MAGLELGHDRGRGSNRYLRIRHLTGDPETAARATAALAGNERLLLTDLVLADRVYVLESFYEVRAVRVAS